MPKVHYFRCDPDEEIYDTKCGRSASLMQKTTDKVLETTCTTCIKRLYSGAILCMNYHNRKMMEAERVARMVSDQYSRWVKDE